MTNQFSSKCIHKQFDKVLQKLWELGWAGGHRVGMLSFKCELFVLHHTVPFTVLTVLSDTYRSGPTHLRAKVKSSH